MEIIINKIFFLILYLFLFYFNKSLANKNLNSNNIYNKTIINLNEDKLTKYNHVNLNLIYIKLKYINSLKINEISLNNFNVDSSKINNLIKNTIKYIDTSDFTINFLKYIEIIPYKSESSELLNVLKINISKNFNSLLILIKYRLKLSAFYDEYMELEPEDINLLETLDTTSFSNALYLINYKKDNVISITLLSNYFQNKYGINIYNREAKLKKNIILYKITHSFIYMELNKNTQKNEEKLFISYDYEKKKINTKTGEIKDFNKN